MSGKIVHLVILFVGENFFFRENFGHQRKISSLFPDKVFPNKVSAKSWKKAMLKQIVPSTDKMYQ